MGVGCTRGLDARGAVYGSMYMCIYVYIYIYVHVCICLGRYHILVLHVAYVVMVVETAILLAARHAE